MFYAHVDAESKARGYRGKPPKERQMRSPWIYRLGVLAALLLSGGAGLKWP